jgi:hypothetical protein
VLLYAHRELCGTDEKWFASGESNVFRLSREDVNGSSSIMITSGRLLSGKDFFSRGGAIFQRSLIIDTVAENLQRKLYA